MEKPNLKLIKEISGNDLDFENNLLKILKKEFREEVNLYNKNLNDKNYGELHQAIHKLKHKISLLGLSKGLEIATLYEEEVKNGNIKHHNEFEKVLHKIHLYLYH